MCVSSQILISVFNTNNQTNVKKTQLFSVNGQSSVIPGDIYLILEEQTEELWDLVGFLV